MSTSYQARPRGASAVVTFVTPSEQQRVDALTNGRCVAMHRDTLDQVLHDLRTHSVSAVIVSVSRYQQQYAPSMARLVREFPRVPAVALLTGNEARSSAALLSLGQHGVRTLVDARDPAGWRTLRTLVTTEYVQDIDTRAIAVLRRDLQGAVSASVRFFETLFTVPRSLTTVQQLARHMGVLPTTLMSRFVRHGIPTPKRYLASARMVRAAHLLENPGCSITQAAFLMEYSSPQSFSRHLSGTLRIGAAEFRRRHTGESMLEMMRDQLVLPYLTQLREFDPFASPPAWLSRAPEPHAPEPYPATAISAPVHHHTAGNSAV
ncbi:helix-turn-helix domain-containing protein [Gemmatimonas sp.]|uniref:helix-turn-helix transcriptional regulator n=1 Tax=Gemmatimonas sp. TaxID=1962908 RepID=UPI0022CC4C9B|nr:helix-turn-helix domain-containing protein [Gemmatimonas sp.]MCZ8206308.1 helix-turn-helix domain-containing protein [Gemmatimonas sp.]